MDLFEFNRAAPTARTWKLSSESESEGGAQEEDEETDVRATRKRKAAKPQQPHRPLPKKTSPPVDLSDWSDDGGGTPSQGTLLGAVQPGGLGGLLGGPLAAGRSATVSPFLQGAPSRAPAAAAPAAPAAAAAAAAGASVEPLLEAMGRRREMQRKITEVTAAVAMDDCTDAVDEAAAGGGARSLTRAAPQAAAATAGGGLAHLPVPSAAAPPAGAAAAAAASEAAATSGAACDDDDGADGGGRLLSFKCQTRKQDQFVKIKLAPDAELGKLFAAFEDFARERRWLPAEVPGSKLKFLFDGDKLLTSSTPDSLDLEGGEQFDVSW